METVFTYERPRRISLAERKTVEWRVHPFSNRVFPHFPGRRELNLVIEALASRAAPVSTDTLSCMVYLKPAVDETSRNRVHTLLSRARKTCAAAYGDDPSDWFPYSYKARAFRYHRRAISIPGAL